jgi:hypothetical protein
LRLYVWARDEALIPDAGQMGPGTLARRSQKTTVARKMGSIGAFLGERAGHQPCDENGSLGAETGHAIVTLSALWSIRSPSQGRTILPIELLAEVLAQMTGMGALAQLA